MTQAVKVCRGVLAHPANRGRALRSLGRAALWQLYKRRHASPKTVPYHGLRFLVWPDSEQSSGVIYFDGWPDYWEMKFLAAYLRRGDHVLDIGANIGVYSVFMAALVGANGSVVAFEPVVASRQRLTQQCELNALANVRIEPFAVSDRSGTVHFGSAGSTATRRIEMDSARAATVEVRSIALDDWPGWRSPTLIKMDIEGAEPLALIGARKRLAEQPPPVILFELAGYAQSFGFASEAVLDLLSQHGYRFHAFDPAEHRLIEATEPWRLGITNVLAVHRDHRAMVEQRLEAA